MSLQIDLCHVALLTLPLPFCYSPRPQLTTTWCALSTTRTGAEKFSRRCKFSTEPVHITMLLQSLRKRAPIGDGNAHDDKRFAGDADRHDGTAKGTAGKGA